MKKHKFSLFELLYPRRCVFCGRILDKNASEDICRDCVLKLPYTGGDWKARGEFFEYCAAPLYYEGLAADAVRRFKFGGRSSYARLMGRMIGNCAAAHCAGEFDVITWVPISLRRMRKRGYCQARLLAQEAAKGLGADCVRLLKKRRHTPPQSTLHGLAERKANVSGAFVAACRDEIAGRDVLLIDDVITTGATLSECTRILLMAGANSVRCAVLCRAREKNAKGRRTSA